MTGSGASFKMDFGGFDRMLDRAAAHFTGATRGLMEECGEAIATGIDEAFEKETAPDGTTWKKSERAASEGGKTLDDTSELRNSIGYEATVDAVAVGTNVPYAVYHQQPERDGEIMPKREFIGVSEETGKELKGILGDFAKAGFSK
jgi:phage virion morphogenesis protein